MTAAFKEYTGKSLNKDEKTIREEEVTAGNHQIACKAQRTGENKGKEKEPSL